MTGVVRLASGAPVPVFVVTGEASPPGAARLRMLRGLRLVESPRAAAILLVAGTIPDTLLPHLHRLHDQLPHPRMTVLWDSGMVDGLPKAPALVGDADVAAVLTKTRNALLSGSLESEADILPDTPPNEWRGVGPNGQGGEGMMGGTPYGRPMAMTAEDLRDGLMLDAYTADFGPFLPMFPPGLILTLTLQGDVIQNAAVAHPPFARGVFDAAEGAARLMRLLGLSALADRLLRDAQEGGVASSGLIRLIRCSGARAAIPPDLGRTPDGSDVRDRFDRWFGDRSCDAALNVTDLTVDDLLVGLEWHEAMLVLNSFDAATLRRICGNGPSGRNAEGKDDEMDRREDDHAGQTP